MFVECFDDGFGRKLFGNGGKPSNVAEKDREIPLLCAQALPIHVGHDGFHKLRRDVFDESLTILGLLPSFGGVLHERGINKRNATRQQRSREGRPNIMAAKEPANSSDVGQSYT